MMGAAKVRAGGGREARTFQNVRDYYAGLPHGWASFPACVARASLLGDLRDRGALDVLESLPPELDPHGLTAHLGDARRHDPLSAEDAWLPEVVHVATLLAVRDARFAEGTRGDEDFQDWLAQLNAQLLDRPENVVPNAGDAPNELLPQIAQIARVWQTFHLGSPATTVARSPTHHQVTLAHPARLFPPLAMESRRRALGVALAKQGAVQPRIVVTTTVTGDTAETLFDVTWA